MSRAGMLEAIKKLATVDGWVNILTGLGDSLRDKRLAAEAQFQPLTETEAEALYGSDDVAAAIVDTLPDEALRTWLTFHADENGDGTDDGDSTIDAAVKDKLEGLNARECFKQAWTWSRLYGGAAVLLNLDDSLDLEAPLVVSAIRDVNSLTVLSRWELMTSTIDLDLNLRSPRYGQPIYYRFAPRRGGANGSGLRIHHSRILRFDGVPLPVRLFSQNHYWGDSVLNRAQNAIRNYQTGNDAAAAIMQEFNQGVFKIKGLADMLMAGNDEAVQQRMATVQMARSICRAVVIDQDEEFTNVGAALSGVPEVIDRLASRLVVAARMPHDKILGESPSGLGATGDSETRNWYDFVAAQRELTLRPKIQTLLTLILASRRGPTRGQVPQTWSFSFDPLWQMDEKELADIRKTQADTDVAYITANVLDPDEVAASRFGTGKYSTETFLDTKARAEGAAGTRTEEEDPGEAPPAAKASGEA